MDWFKIEILTGLQKLALLGLPWMPPMELIAGTGAAWVEALEHGRLWNQERDTMRLREGFTKLMGTATQWPSPAKLIECLPAIQEKPALPARIFTPEECKRNIHELADLIKGAFP